jgi:hypothetical protein
LCGAAQAIVNYQNAKEHDAVLAAGVNAKIAVIYDRFGVANFNKGAVD